MEGGGGGGGRPLSSILSKQEAHRAALSSKECGGRSPSSVEEQTVSWELQLRAAASISNPELRSREEAYIITQLRKLEKAKKNRDEEAQRLRESDSKRKMDDARVRGFQSSGLFTHALPLRNSSESLAERALESDLRQQGEATGDSWVKTDHGWLRRKNPVVERKSELSELEFSTQAYEAVELRFGLRRSRAWDYELAVRCLAELYAKYCASGARSLQNAMYRDVGVAMKTFMRFPQAGEAILHLLTQCRLATEAIRRACVNSGMSVTVHDERLQQISVWTKTAEDLHRAVLSSASLQQLHATTCLASVGEGPMAWLPDELIVKIFSFLEEPRDLVRITSVCARWYDLGNDDYLFRTLLSGQLDDPELEARVARVRSYKTVYMQLHSKFFVPTMGCFLCASCDALYWAAKNVSKQCRQLGDGHQNRATFSRHQPGVALSPESLTSGLLLAWWAKNRKQ